MDDDDVGICYVFFEECYVVVAVVVVFVMIFSYGGKLLLVLIFWVKCTKILVPNLLCFLSFNKILALLTLMDEKML